MGCDLGLELGGKGRRDERQASWLRSSRGPPPLPGRPAAGDTATTRGSERRGEGAAAGIAPVSPVRARGGAVVPVLPHQLVRSIITFFETNKKVISTIDGRIGIFCN